VPGSLPEENLFLVGAITGLTRSEPFWAEKDEFVNLFHIKGTVETLFDRLHIKAMNFKVSQYPVIRSENCQCICSGKNQIGFIGELNRSILEKWDIRNNVFVFEIPVRRLQEMLPDRINYTPIPKFPSVKRDLALIIEKNIPVGSIESFIKKNGGKNLISVKLFDLYRGKQILPGEKSVAFSLTFQSSTGTLKEVDIDPVINSLIKKLQDSFSAKLRS
jgi:phenylalanyl-tRNA synthetase beta chain